MKTRPFTLVLFLIAGLIHHTSAQTWDPITKVVAGDRGAEDQLGQSVSVSGRYAIAGAYYEDHDVMGNDSLADAGAAYIYERDANGTWVQKQKLVPSDRAQEDLFGYSVSISGNYAVVSAVWEDEDTSGTNFILNAGSAYVFERNTSGVWLQVQKLVPSDRDLTDQFGYSVSISGNCIVIGSIYEQLNSFGGAPLSNAGAAYIFERDIAGTWVETQKIVNSDRASGDHFGWTVSLSGNYAIIGAIYEDHDVMGGSALTQSGSAYVFERDFSGYWSQTQKIVASDRAANDFFGWAISVSGNYAVIGTYAEDENVTGTATLSDAGSAYIYERNSGGTWIQKQKVVAPDRAANDWFGFSVAVSGKYILVGAAAEDHDVMGTGMLSESGSVYLFERNTAGTWNFAQKMVATDRGAGDRFGWSVALAGKIGMVGASYDDKDDMGGGTILSNAGSAYLFSNCTPLPGSTHHVTACGMYTWMDGVTYTANNNTATYQAINTYGCDSTVTLNLTILQPTDSTITTSSCNSYVLNSTTYTATGTYTQVLTNAVGCDSTITLHLEILSNTGSFSATACESIQVNSMTYTISGSYLQTLTNAAGCDSVVTVNVIINHANTGVTATGVTITATATPAIYQWVDCNAGFAPMGGETNQSYTATVNGSYAVIVTESGCADTSACVNITSLGIHEGNKSELFTVYPNPASDVLTVHLPTAGLVTISTPEGKTAWSGALAKGSNIINISHLHPGVYLITGIGIQGKTRLVKL